MKKVQERDVQLVNAAKRGSIDTVRKLIDKGADVNAFKYCKTKDLIPEEIKDNMHWFEEALYGKKNTESGRFNTALMLVVRSGHHQCAQVLVDAGADVNKTNGLGFTALMNAICFENNKECLSILIKAGADVNFKNNIGQTALHLATFLDNYKGMKILLEAGANINACDKRKYTALISAVRCNSSKCIELLLESGANVNTRDDEGLTPLSVSAKCKYPKGTDLLLKAGADVSIMDDSGYSALMFAAMPCGFPNYKCVCLLLKAGSPILTLKPRHSFIPVNATEILMCGWRNDKNEGIHRALFAAGEVVQRSGLNSQFPGYLQELYKPEGNLKDTCRRAIRKHLMDLSPVNLFCKIPRLGFPELMEDYLFYGITLDENDETYNYSYDRRRKPAVGSQGPSVTNYGRTSRKPDRFNVC